MGEPLSDGRRHGFDGDPLIEATNVRLVGEDPAGVAAARAAELADLREMAAIIAGTRRALNGSRPYDPLEVYVGRARVPGLHSDAVGRAIGAAVVAESPEE